MGGNEETVKAPTAVTLWKTEAGQYCDSVMPPAVVSEGRMQELLKKV